MTTLKCWPSLCFTTLSGSSLATNLLMPFALSYSRSSGSVKES